MALPGRSVFDERNSITGHVAYDIAGMRRLTMEVLLKEFLRSYPIARKTTTSRIGSSDELFPPASSFIKHNHRFSASLRNHP